MAPNSRKEFLLEARNLGIAFKRKKVIEDLSLRIKKGECLGVVGDNGSGKTTLALYLAGVIPDFIPAQVQGETTSQGKPGLVMQNPSAQFFALTVKEELENEQAGKEFGLQDLMERSVFELSEGEKQKINLVAHALNGSEIILLDEPLELLDPFEQQRFKQVLQKLKREGKTLVWLDKDETFMGLADRKIYLAREKSQRKVRRAVKKKGENVLAGNFSLALGEFSLKANLKLARKEKVALIGRNGAGKTLLLKALAGLQKVEGEIRRKDRVSLAVQNPGHQFYQETVEEEIRCRENIKALELEGLLKEDPSRLSRGQKKMVSIASTGKGIVLLDEPTTWLDPKNKRLVYDFIENSDEAMVIATHDPDLLSCCDRVLMVEGGEVKDCSSTQTKRFFQGCLKA